MSQQEPRALRADELTLCPMQRTLEHSERKRLKNSLILLFVSMSVPILLLIELRYVLAGSYVAADANPLLGAIGLLCLVITGILTSVSKYSNVENNRQSALGMYGWSFAFTFAAFILIGWHVVDHSMSVVSHFGMTAIADIGTSDFYVLCLLITLAATRGRVKRLNVKNNWGLVSTSYFAWFVVAVWLVEYVLTYFV